MNTQKPADTVNTLVASDRRGQREQPLADKRIGQKRCIVEHGGDQPEIPIWKWSNPK
jgi:phosphoketolase